MCFVNENVVTTACVTDFCQEIENRLEADYKFVECLCQTNWRTFSKRASYLQNALAKDTKQVLEWFDKVIDPCLNIKHENIRLHV